VRGETREEQRARLMREIGNWYLVKENGKPHKFVLQYHVRGVWPEDELDEINAFLRKSDDLEEIVRFLRKHDARYLVGDLKKMAEEAQKADDARKDVSSIIKAHLAPIPGDTRKAIEMIKWVGWSASRVYNVGNVHIDHRMVEPGGRYLIGWTHDIPKVAVQNLKNDFFYPLRDRLLEWKPGDQWMAQQKLAQPLAWLTIVSPGKMIYQAEPGEVGACLAEGTPVLVRDKGWTRIEKVKRGDEVFGHDGKYHRVTFTWVTEPEERRCFRVILDGFSFVVTEDHPLWVSVNKGKPDFMPVWRIVELFSKSSCKMWLALPANAPKGAAKFATGRTVSRKHLLVPFEICECDPPVRTFNLSVETVNNYLIPGAISHNTAETAGYFFWKASGLVAYGCQKSDYCEYWLKFEKPFKRIMRVDIKLIDTPGNYRKAPLDRIWLVAPPPYRQDTPYIMHHKYEVEAEKAKRDKIEMIWNEKVLDILLEWGVITKERVEREASLPKRAEVGKFYIAKMDEELRVVKGFVLVPNKIDKQRDYISAKEIEKAAHRFLLKGGRIKIEHQHDAPMVKVVESAVLEAEMQIGEYVFPRGSWWVALKVFDNELWHKIKSGVYKGFSVGGYAKRLKREGVVNV